LISREWIFGIFWARAVGKNQDKSHDFGFFCHFLYFSLDKLHATVKLTDYLHTGGVEVHITGKIVYKKKKKNPFS
jgi:hypothetical protein